MLNATTDAMGTSQNATGIFIDIFSFGFFWPQIYEEYFEVPNFFVTLHQNKS